VTTPTLERHLSTDFRTARDRCRPSLRHSAASTPVAVTSSYSALKHPIELRSSEFIVRMIVVATCVSRSWISYDSRERGTQWVYQPSLLASKTALHHGVEYFNGQPALPMPLRELLTDTCAHCGHAMLHWIRSIDALEREVASLDSTIVERQRNLDSHMAALRRCSPKLSRNNVG
jgi:hypothetical protein